MLRRTQGGFTLIELLVVIAIIGMLSSVVLASLNTARTKGRDARRLTDMKSIVAALELYALDNATYPNTGAGSWVNSLAGTQWIPGLAPTYISVVPIDPVNTYSTSLEVVYHYNSDGKDYCIQISQEGACASNPYYIGAWNGACMLRIGTSRLYCTSY